MTTSDLGVLYVVACGGQPALGLEPFVCQALAAGWDVCVIATPSGTRFVDVARLAELTGHPVRSEYKRPGEPDVLPPADAFVVAPATFNTVNKLAAGISDTLALGLLCEAIGAGKPILLAPSAGGPLAHHPALAASLATLRGWGIHVLPDPTAEGLPFPWDQLSSELSRLAAQRRAGARPSR
ncbi:flavoprotein [Frankia sp. CNm7]|uniref:Flavoprotein n=1 Tax=Frankia nepalensis TaxID=1836974 RepID=A0A937RTZ6_9ACTN|nr:flavoprotein [Frankia nepalensis]MBL7499497.1 flavoprotein [Frankia nepalensis]MBL7516008.1 flavoprotein [Frankia nepalensis]MBL7522332.1 flavoprotein [Frankia nepalensis]MBL7631871.1 flavoprotein [Frankia nepalensis]